MTSQDELVRIARGVIDANSYLTLATADRNGLPWPSPVWYAHAGYRDFFWISSPAARHSRNLTERPEAGIVIFDSRVPAGAGQAVYLTATAAEVTPDELSRGIEVFSARSQEMGIRAWTPDEVRGPARLRLYRATVSELFVLDGADQRLPVELLPWLARHDPYAVRRRHPRPCRVGIAGQGLLGPVTNRCPAGMPFRRREARDLAGDGRSHAEEADHCGQEGTRRGSRRGEVHHRPAPASGARCGLPGS